MSIQIKPNQNTVFIPQLPEEFQPIFLVYFNDYIFLKNRNEIIKNKLSKSAHLIAHLNSWIEENNIQVKTLDNSEVLKYLDQVTVKCNVCKETSTSCPVCFGLGRITTEEESIINVVGSNWCQCETPKPSAQLYETPVPVWKCTSCNKIQELENEQEM